MFRVHNISTVSHTGHASCLLITAYFRTIFATTHRLLLENIRAYPWSFFVYRFINSFFTILLAFFMYNAFAGKNNLASFQVYSGSNDYLTFIVVSVSIYAYGNGALLILGRSLIGEMRTGTMEVLFLTPARNSSYLLGVALQHIMLTTIDFLLIIFAGLLFGANLSKANWPEFVLVLIIGHIGLLGMGIVLSAVMLYLRDTYITQNTILGILYLICGVLFPIQYLPHWVQRIAQLVPLSYILILGRESVINGYGPREQWVDLLILFIISLIYYVVGLVLVRKVRRIALEETFS